MVLMDENSVRFPMAKHYYKINFYRYTSVKMCSMFSGSMYGFEFADFHDILAEKNDHKYPIDVIGDLHSCGELDDYSKNGRKTKRISFELVNVGGEKVRGTLWGTFAQQLYDSVSELDRSLHIILIIQLGKRGTWEGKPVVSNGLFGTRLFIDTELDEITSFRQRFKVKVRVQDGTGSVSFVLFDHEVSQIINKTIDELFDKLSEAGEVELFPEELNELVGKRYAFKIDVAPYNLNKAYRVYIVVKMTDDQRILSKLMNGSVDGQANKSELSSQGMTSSCVTGVVDDRSGHDMITTPTSSGKRAMDVIDLDVSQSSSTKKKLLLHGCKKA